MTCEGVEPMGRGRAKAKQTKVARELKYRNYETDFSELQRELHGDGQVPSAGEVETKGATDIEDPSADTHDNNESVNQR